MALQPVRTGDDATMVTLRFGENENDLENIDRQTIEAEVVHEVQTKRSVLSPYVMMTDLGNNTFKWKPFTYKRDPRQINQNLSKIQPSPQTFDAFGCSVSKYGDDVWLTDYVKEKSVIRFQREVLTEMFYGFERLKDRNCIAAMFNPVRWRYTPDWKRGGATTRTIALPNNRIVAIAEQDGSNLKLAVPTSETYMKLKRRFTDFNVMPGEKVYGLLTPNMMDIIAQNADYKNREHVYRMVTAMESEDSDRGFTWRGITWVRCTPEIAPGAYYAGSVFSAGSTALKAGEQKLVERVETATQNAITLNATNHEVIPLWIKKNIYAVTNKSQDKFNILPQPEYKGAPAAFREQSLGGTRVQNVLHLNVVVPVV